MPTAKAWVIQKYNTQLRLYENITSQDHLLDKKQMKVQLKKFEATFPNAEFRGHNWVNCEKHKADQYKP